MRHDVAQQSFGVGPLPSVRYDLRIRPSSGRELVGEVGWRLRSFVLDEGVHVPYVLDVEAIAGAADFDLDTLIGARLDLEIARGEALRVLHGVVQQVELLGDHGDGVRVRLQTGPAFGLLRLTERSRVFQGQTVVEIAQRVAEPILTEHGSALHIDRLVSTVEPRDYCVQHRETDLDFVLRILAEEGITVLFDHGGDREVVVLTDDNQALVAAGLDPLGEATTVVPMLPFVPERSDELATESINAVTQAQRMGRRQWRSTVWGWKTRPITMLGTTLTDDEAQGLGEWSQTDVGRMSEGERSDGLVTDGSAKQAKLRRERDGAAALRLLATSNATILRPGSVFDLAGTPHDGYGQTWVVTRVRHHGAVPQASVHGSADDDAPEYGNDFECQPHTAPIVPDAPIRPIVRGVQTAIVTGPSDETIHTDRFGRIRVRMAWDGHTDPREETSCWLRVALPWAGDGFGAMFVPRIGTEVVVSFVDGDPDRPLCTGCVHDGATMPPYALPEHKTRTVLRTASTKGDGFNELSFEDAAGSEEVFLHAQRNLREVVKAGHTMTVGASQRQSVGACRRTSIGKDDELNVAGDCTRAVEGDLTEKVGGAYRLRVSAAPQAPGNLEGLGIVVERGTYELQAADAIILRCGSCRLEIYPEKIVLEGPEIIARCPGKNAIHSTSISLTAGAIDVATDQLRQRAVDAKLEVKRRIALDVGPDGLTTSLRLDAGVTLRTGTEMELRARNLVAAGTNTTTIKGSTCEVGGEVVSVRGNRVGIDAEARVEISTPGQVNIRGQEKITLN